MLCPRKMLLFPVVPVDDPMKMFENPFPVAFAPIAITSLAIAAPAPARNPKYAELLTFEILLPAPYPTAVTLLAPFGKLYTRLPA